MSDNSSVGSSLLPAPLRKPAWLLGTLVAPQVLLLLLNLRSWWLVAGEMTATQTGDAVVLGLAGALLWLGGLTGSCRMIRRGASLDWRHGILMLFSHIAYLWAFTAHFENILPASVPDWMLSRGTVMYHQYALIMPALLHGALLVACFSARRSLGVEIGRAVALTVAPPVVAYLFVNLTEHFHRCFDGRLVFPVVLIFFVGLTALLIMGLLRLLLLVGGGLRRWGGHGRMVLIALVGVAGPLGGLLLNRNIPFPCDFQSWGVYALALLNGLTLLFPVDGTRVWHRLAWLAQCALFSFTAYFMLVFLPFLPLAILAVIAMGAGLLMLVPLVLFVAHAQQLVAGWQAVRRGTSAAAWTAAALAALLALPAGYVVRAHQDRAALNTALDHVHNADYAQGRYQGDLIALRRGLENLRDFKSGLQLPFIGDYYNHVVFGGLVLPDDKLNKLYLTFFGKPIPPSNSKGFGASTLFGPRRRLSWNGWRSNPPPTNTVDLVALESVRTVESDCETAVAKLTLHNRGAAQAEYVARLHVPPGVFVSGFWLHINGARVAGRLFEKKAALWVYEMIRDLSRRDPGLLLYRDSTTVELRVFPLNKDETRTTEIEFIWPRGLAPVLRVADRTLDTSTGMKSPAVQMVSAGEQGRLLVVSPSRLRDQGAKPMVEPPYLHLIVEASDGTDPAKAALRAQAIAAREPAVRDVVVSAANFEMETVMTAPVPLDRLAEAIRTIRLPARGGFCRDRALKSALVWNAAHAPGRGVVLGVIAGEASRAVLSDDDIPFFTAWHPAVRGYWECGSDGVARAFDFQRQAVTNVSWTLTPVAVDGRLLPAPLDGEEPVVFALPPGPAGSNEITNARYRAAAAVWLHYASWLERPAGRDDERARLVSESRAANVLMPLTSFIVVENTAQWRLLEQKEKQKLQNKDALEIAKAPEPSVWILIAAFAAWSLWRRRRIAARA